MPNPANKYVALIFPGGSLYRSQRPYPLFTAVGRVRFSFTQVKQFGCGQGFQRERLSNAYPLQ